MTLLLEVPTGAIADRISRKFSLVLGSIMLTLGALTYSIGTNFTQFMIAETLWALSLALVSGADTALIYDSLKAMKMEKMFRKIQGKAMFYYLITGGIASIAGGLIGKYSFRFTWFATAIASLGLIVMALRFYEPKKTIDVEQPKYWDLIFQSIKFVKKHRLIKWYIFFFSITGLAGAISFWITQPYLKNAGLDIVYFGFVFFFFNIIAAIASKLSYKIEGKLGTKGVLYLLGAIAVIPFFFLGSFTFKLGFILMALYQISKGLSSPVFEHILLKYTFADKRATVLSLKNLVYRIIYAIVVPFVGYFSDTYSLGVALILSGAFFLIGMIIFFIMYIRIPLKYFKVKKNVTIRQ